MTRRGVWPAAVTLLGLGVPVGGCDSQGAVSGRDARFEFSCCGAGVAAVQQPGQSVTLRWIAHRRPSIGSATAAAVTLSVSLTGPFPDVATLAAAMADGTSPAPMVTAADVLTTDRAGGTPTSILLLPSQAPAGFYDVRTTASSTGGALSRDGILRVVADRPSG